MSNDLTSVDGVLPQLHTIEIDSTASLDKPGVGAPDGKDADFDTAISTPLIRAAAILTEITRHGRYKLRRRDNAIAFYEVGKLLSGVKKNVERGHFSHTLTSRNISPDTSKFAIRVYESLESIENSACLFDLGTSKLVELTLKKHHAALCLLATTGEIAGETLEGLVKMGLNEFRRFIKTVPEFDVNASLSIPALDLQPGDRIESLHARRPGAVVKVYADGSACVCWDDGEPQEAGLGHERMPRNLLVKVASEAAPARGDVNAAFEAQAATASNVNEGGTGPTAAPEAAPQPDPQAAPADNIRRVDAQLQVHWAGRVFDVSKAGVGVGDDVMCQPAPIPPFLWVRKIDASQQDHMATMVEPVEPPPQVAPQVAPPDPALTHRKLYLRERMKVVLRYADGPELNDIEDLLDELVSDISRGRYVPGLVAADYELTRKYWIEGSAK